MDNNESAIRQLIENWAQAVRSRNIDAIIAHHSQDMIMFDVTEPFQSRGIDAYRKTWDMFFKDTEPGIFDIQELRIVAGDQVAFCIALMNCSTKSNANDFENLDFRLTVGLRKIAGQWMIVHEHHSIPAQ